jgi:hypothetical protein
VYFLQFSVSKIRVSPTHVVSSLFPPRCRFYSVRRRHTVTPCHASFSCSQDEFAPSTSSSVNTSSRRLPSQAEIKVLNLYHRHSPTLILNCYKKSHLNLGHSLHHSTTSLFYLLTSQSATSSELHSLLLLFTIIPHISSIRTTKR